METQRPFDLSTIQLDAGGKQLSLENIASNGYFAWEGQLSEALLSVPKPICDYLRSCRLQFREYVKLAKVDLEVGISLDYAECWEIMLLKRLQELFFAEAESIAVSPRFLSAPIFGSCRFRLTDLASRFPKITAKGYQLNLQLLMTPLHFPPHGPCLFLRYLPRRECASSRPVPAKLPVAIGPGHSDSRVRPRLIWS